jgi:putative protease
MVQKRWLNPIEVPVLKERNHTKIKPSLSVLISSPKDLYLCNETSATICFQLPACFKNERSEITDLFIKNKKLIPWFPPVLIGEDYRASIRISSKGATQLYCDK